MKKELRRLVLRHPFLIASFIFFVITMFLFQKFENASGLSVLDDLKSQVLARHFDWDFFAALLVFSLPGLFFAILFWTFRPRMDEVGKIGQEVLDDAFRNVETEFNIEPNLKRKVTEDFWRKVRKKSD